MSGFLNIGLNPNKFSNKVCNNLIVNGINIERITTEGKGESEPLFPNSNSKFRSFNRRVEFIFY